MESQFPTYEEFIQMHYTKQRKVYEEQIRNHKIKGSTPIWVERIQTAIKLNNPVGLLIMPDLGKFYYDFIDERQMQLFS